MDTVESLNHSVWDCKYHVVFIPKCRRKTLYGELRQYLGEVFRRLAQQKESRIEEGHLLSDHVHMLIAVPPKYAVAQVVGFIKGMSAIHLARVYGERCISTDILHFAARVLVVEGCRSPKLVWCLRQDEWRPLTASSAATIGRVQTRKCASFVGGHRRRLDCAVWSSVSLPGVAVAAPRFSRISALPFTKYDSSTRRRVQSFAV
jgi:putative transposase